MSDILGIDTSCYTTSVAVVNTSQQLIMEHRQLLQVPLGSKGLQQSWAVFQHMKNLPVLLDKVAAKINFHKISTVVVSNRPRPAINSYMPVFQVGLNFAKTVSTILQVPVKLTSHQEGHIMAGLWSANVGLLKRFITVHLSGGTSEILLVEKLENEETVFNVNLLGSTKDISAGQLVDRVGVAMGFPFPCGYYIEDLAKNAQGTITIPSTVKNTDFSFSGAEAQAKRLLENGENKAEIARAIESCIAKTIEKAILKATEKFNCSDVLVVGGVASNQFIKARLCSRLQHKSFGIKTYFAESRYSSDNAVGCALIGIL
ncbi:O-sialoglycoprotein endopeptidase [Bacillota bacterium LX-D]|nr:O-sialoglycoprotein endopeptidase [Bacillota bacterium LX-D]